MELRVTPLLADVSVDNLDLLMNDELKKALERIKQLEKALNDRNEATKVWIQSDTQVRAYANQLERENSELRAEIAALLASNKE